jgi:hypothetical protein
MPLLTVLAAVPVWLARNKTGAEDDDPHRARFDDCSAVALGCLIMLLSLRLVWMHYYVLAAPGIVLLLAPVGESRWDTAALVTRRVLPAVALVVLCIQPLVGLGVVRGFESLAVVVCSSTAILFVSLLRTIVSTRQGR